MEVKETLQATVTKEVTSKIKCDGCGKILYDIDNPPATTSDANKQPYYHIRTWHHDWGNDSVESMETFDLCDDCIMAQMQQFLNHPSLTKEMEIERQTPSCRGRNDIILV